MSRIRGFDPLHGMEVRNIDRWVSVIFDRFVGLLPTTMFLKFFCDYNNLP